MIWALKLGMDRVPSFSWKGKNEFYPVGEWEIIMKETRPMPGLIFFHKVGGGSEEENLHEGEA